MEDIVALLDEPRMTVEAAVERILSTRKPNVALYARLNPILRHGCRTWQKSATRAVGFLETDFDGTLRNQEPSRDRAEAEASTSRTSGFE